MCPVLLATRETEEGWRDTEWGPRVLKVNEMRANPIGSRSDDVERADPVDTRPGHQARHYRASVEILK